jgi:hypothetical protein
MHGGSKKLTQRFGRGIPSEEGFRRARHIGKMILKCILKNRVWTLEMD